MSHLFFNNIIFIMGELKWTSSNIIEFFNMYQNYPCLWDVSSEEFLNRYVKESSYNKLVHNLLVLGIPCTLELIKRKIKCLRDTYRKELHKILKSKRSGVAANEIYTTKLVWFSAAEVFWREAGTDKKSCNPQCSSPESERDSSSNSDGEQTAPQIKSPESAHLGPTQPVSCTSTTKRKCLFPQMLPPRRARMLKCSPGSKHPPIKFENKINKLQHIAQLSTSHKEDQYDQFAKHIVFQLRELPLKSFILLQSKIQNIITIERLASLQAVPLFHCPQNGSESDKTHCESFINTMCIIKEEEVELSDDALNFL